MIEVEGLTYTYPNQDAAVLGGIDWTIRDGEFVLVAGPSGSGKSTLLRSLNGLVPHFTGGRISGRVSVYGLDPLVAGPRRLSSVVGFVSQNPEASAVLDIVEDEIAFALENQAVPEAQMRRRIDEALDLLALGQLRRRAIRSLSGGERQRVAIGCALVLRPRALVLDEPTSQLDPESAGDVLRALVSLNRELGLTIIVAEHRLERIGRYASRLTYLTRGHIVADGPVRETLARVPSLPPLMELARLLEWQPMPVTAREGRQFSAHLSIRRSAATEPHVTGEPVLEVSNVSFAYDGQPALRGVDLLVHRGEAVAVIGRNGAGKSTLLRCIVGLLKPQNGDFKLDGLSILDQGVAQRCRSIAYLPQNSDDLLFADTVADELRITLQNHKLPVDEQAVRTTLKQLQIEDLADRYPRDLSVGQRQRVALGAITVTQPRLILLDEPTRGLDMAMKESLIEVWRGWLARGGSLLLVTHDVEMVAMIARRTLLLNEGQVVAQGATRNVLGASPQFAPQIARLFPGCGMLTVSDVVQSIAAQQDEVEVCQD